MTIVKKYEDYNFCLDKNILRLIKVHPSAAYRRVILEGSLAVNIELKSFTASYDIPYFKNKVDIDVGQKVHNYFLKYDYNILEDLIFLNNFILMPARIRIRTEEMDKNFNILSSQEIGEYYFYPGKKPEAYPLLTNGLRRRRVSGSKILLSFIEGTVDPGTWGLLNDWNTGRRENNEVYSFQITDREMNFPLLKTIEKVSFIAFPEVRRVVHVQWLNQNLVPDWFSFTGEYKISRGFSHSISKSVFMEQKKKFNTEKEKTLKINTGFILKSEIPMVEEMMESPFCFIELEDRMLKCIPSGEKMGEEDSTAQLISFELEFLIIEERWI